MKTEQSHSGRHLLIVEPSETVAHYLYSLLKGEGEIEMASDGKEAIKRIATTDYDLIITDLDVEPMGGMAFYFAVTRQNPELSCRFLFFTGSISESDHAFFKREGIRYLMKPSDSLTLQRVVSEILNDSTMERSHE